MNKIRILLRTIPPEKYRPGKGCVYETRGICATLVTGWGNLVPTILLTYEQSNSFHPGVEVQPERLGIPHGGGVSPCLGVGQHHGTEPKIALIYEPMESNRRDDSHAHSKTGESAK